MTHNLQEWCLLDKKGKNDSMIPWRRGSPIWLKYNEWPKTRKYRVLSKRRFPSNIFSQPANEENKTIENGKMGYLHHLIIYTVLCYQFNHLLTCSSIYSTHTTITYSVIHIPSLSTTIHPFHRHSRPEDNVMEPEKKRAVIKELTWNRIRIVFKKTHSLKGKRMREKEGNEDRIIDVRGPWLHISFLSILCLYVAVINCGDDY